MKSKSESSSKEDAVEVIREGVRDLTSAERKKHRETALNKSRVTLGEVTEASYTPEFVTEKAKALRKKSLSAEDYRRLQNALIQSEEHVSAFLSVDNVLYALVHDLFGRDPALQFCAASCCCNIALGNAKACTALAKYAAPYLIAQQGTLNPPLLEVSVWTIGNLVAGSSKAFEILHAQDCLRYIVSLIRNCDSTILPSIAYTAMHYVHSGFHHVPEDEMVKLADVLKERSPMYRDQYFMWLLALLSSIPACTTYLHKFVTLAVDYLYQNNINNFAAVSEVTASIRLLANTVSESTGEVAHMFLKNPNYSSFELQTLLNKLLMHQCMHIRKETLWLIGNLYNHNSTEVQQTIKDTLPSLSCLKQAVASVTQ